MTIESPKQRKRYDYVVIGSGPAGFTSSITAAQSGLKVAVVQAGTDMLGGVCLEEGVIPAKSLIHSASVLTDVKDHGKLFGLELSPGKTAMSPLVERSQKTIRQLRGGLRGLFKRNGIDVINGFAHFADQHSITVEADNGETCTLEADSFLIATGSKPKPLLDVPFDGQGVISSSEAVSLSETPDRILIVGGGAIGAEFACFFNAVGSEVIVVEYEESLLPFEDKDIRAGLTRLFSGRGINLYTSAKVTKATKTSNGMEVTVRTASEELLEQCDLVLVSTGRSPCSSSLGLDMAGVEIDERGFIPVNDLMQTNVSHILAAGDVVPTPMLANVALIEGENAAMTAAGRPVKAIDYSLVPNVVYTDVQVASLGLTEDQVTGSKVEYSVGVQPLIGTFKASINSQRDGFVKVIADAKTGEILGAHILASEASELIQTFTVAKIAGLPVQEVARTIPPNPTFSESIADACRAAFGRTVRD